MALLIVFFWSGPDLALADEVPDLLNSIPTVNEKQLDNSACGVAAATMVLDYYLHYAHFETSWLDIHTVANYVKDTYHPGSGWGTDPDQVRTGIDQASTALIQFPLTSTWHTTDSKHWFPTLKAELRLKRPVILYITDGHNLGWSWHYVHYIVVSGYTSDGSIVYHDPWDGQAHTLSNKAFASAWGQGFPGRPAWYYLDIAPGSTPTKPGGTWITPPGQGSFTSNIVHFAAHAYPTHPGDPPIDHVNFTIWWPALGPKTGPWKTACVAKRPTSGDIFQCDADLAQLGAPAGNLSVSFDVYDQVNDANLSPQGEHILLYTPPVSLRMRRPGRDRADEVQETVPNSDSTSLRGKSGYGLPVEANCCLVVDGSNRPFDAAGGALAIDSIWQGKE